MPRIGCFSFVCGHAKSRSSSSYEDAASRHSSTDSGYGDSVDSCRPNTRVQHVLNTNLIRDPAFDHTRDSGSMSMSASNSQINNLKRVKCTCPFCIPADLDDLSISKENHFQKNRFEKLQSNFEVEKSLFFNTYDGRYFDMNDSCFKHLKTASQRYGESSFRYQLEQLEPFIQYYGIEFQYPSPDVQEKLTTIQTEYSDVTADEFKLLQAKCDSLLAIYKCVDGRNLEAGVLLSNIEEDIAMLEPCELTAWYHVAKFFSTILDLAELGYSGRFRTYSKQQCIHHLLNARHAFQVFNQGYALEAALTLWWAFLIQVDITPLPMDRKLISKAKSNIAQMNKADRLCTLEYITSFYLETRNLKFFPHYLLDVDICSLIKLLEDDVSTISGVTLDQSNQSNDSSVDKDDLHLLDETYYNFVEKIEGTEPESVQRIMRNKVDGKVYIVISDEYTEDLHAFLEINGANNPHFAIRMGENVILCIKSEGRPGNAVGIIVDDKITPGAILLRVHKEVRGSVCVPKTLNEFLSLDEIERLGLKGKQISWTIGGLVDDQSSGKKYVLTTAHCVGSDTFSSNDLMFLSARLKRNGDGKEDIVRELCPVSDNEYHGHFGAYCKSGQRGSKPLVDVMLIEVDEKFLQNAHVDMIFKEMGKPINMEIYTCDVGDLQDMEVSMYGCVSGKCIGTGIIKDTCVDSLRINQKMFSGIFAVVMKGDENNARNSNHSSKKRIAGEGDSGAVVFGYNSVTDKHIAVGLVLGKNNEAHNFGKGHMTSTGETYRYVTYCTLLSLAKECIIEKFGLDIEMHKPRNHADCKGNICDDKPVAHQSANATEQAKESDSGYSTGMHVNTSYEQTNQCAQPTSSESEDRSSTSEFSAKPKLYSLKSRHNEGEQQELIRRRYPSRSKALCTLDGTWSSCDSASGSISLDQSTRRMQYITSNSNQSSFGDSSAYDATYELSDSDVRSWSNKMGRCEGYGSYHSTRSSILSEDRMCDTVLAGLCSIRGVESLQVRDPADIGEVTRWWNEDDNKLFSSEPTGIVKPKSNNIASESLEVSVGDSVEPRKSDLIEFESDAEKKEEEDSHRLADLIGIVRPKTSKNKNAKNSKFSRIFGLNNSSADTNDKF